MSRIIDDVLDVYFNVHGRLRLRLASVDLAAIIRAAITTTRPTFADRGHRISVSLPPEPVVFVADASRLQQIFTNLLTNAAKYTEPGGHICVTAGRWSEVVVIRVSDNGRGIDPELLPRIFDPFQQGEDGGLGLGLALVKSLVELHGGGVAVRSEGPGMGSEFVVHLPAAGPGGLADEISSLTGAVNGDLMASPKVDAAQLLGRPTNFSTTLNCSAS